MALVTMRFPVARRYALAGYAIRRAIWNDVEGGHELAWVTYRYGLYHYTTATETRVVHAADVGADDLRASDWTLQGVAGDPVAVPPVEELPVPGGSGGGGGSGAGAGGAGSGGGGGGGGSGPGDYPADPDAPVPGDFDDPNGGGDEGGGGDDPPPRRKRPDPTETEMTLVVTRTSSGCIPLVGGLPSQAPVEDDFSFNLDLSATTDAPAGLWFYSVHHGSPTGPKVAQSGTISPGDGVDGTFSITAPRGQGPFRVWAKAYRSGTGYSASANEKAEMRNTDCSGGSGVWTHPTSDDMGSWINDALPGYTVVVNGGSPIGDGSTFLSSLLGLCNVDEEEGATISLEGAPGSWLVRIENMTTMTSEPITWTMYNGETTFATGDFNTWTMGT